MGAGIVEKDDSQFHMEYDFGFVGNMGYGANQASLDLICIEVLPRLPGTSIRVVGVCPEEVKERYARFNQLSFSGRVESISDELLKCKVMLVPFAYGTGIKTKVLEAMGMGIPVVTNSIGLEGLTCVPGNEIEIGETPEELAQLAAALLMDSERRLAVGNAGKAYVCKNHDWRNSIQDFGKCLEYARRNFGKSE